MRVLCPAGCGKKFISQLYAESHADSEHPDWKTPKSKGWVTPYGFADFQWPVTYEYACAQMKVIYDSLNTDNQLPCKDSGD